MYLSHHLDSPVAAYSALDRQPRRVHGPGEVDAVEAGGSGGGVVVVAAQASLGAETWTYSQNFFEMVGPIK